MTSFKEDEKDDRGEDDDESSTVVICKRGLYDCLSMPPTKRLRSAGAALSLADAFALLAMRREDELDDENEDERTEESDTAIYNLVVIADRVLDCNEICRWLPNERAIVLMLRSTAQIEEDFDATMVPANDDETYRVVECGDDCDATLAMLVGVASLAAKHVAIVSNLSLARRCAELIDGATDCSACIFDSVDKLESHVRALFDDDDEFSDNDDDDAEEEEEENKQVAAWY
jgi:hypothetical protein